MDAAGGALVYFGCTPESGPVVRAVPARRIPQKHPEAALSALLAGPTEAERAQGYLSTFEPRTAHPGRRRAALQSGRGVSTVASR